MFQQFYQPHPALKEFVNNIMIYEVKFDVANAKSIFPFPPLPEQDSLDGNNESMHSILSIPTIG